MTSEGILGAERELLDEGTLIDFVESRRWFGSKAQEVSHARLIDAAMIRSDDEPLFVAALAEIQFQPGTHETYQLLLGFRRAESGWDRDVVSEVGGWVAYDALSDPTLARELVLLMQGETDVPSNEGALAFRPVDLAPYGAALGEPRLVSVEQSNTSVVFGDELILKAYRRLEAGLNPELELLRFLTARGFPHIAALAGWYAYEGHPLDATLGILQQYVPGATGGWELALEELRRDAERFITRLRQLGEVTGELHSALGSEPSDPDFCADAPSVEALSLLVASVDEEIEGVFLSLPEHDALAPIAGRGEDVRDRLRMISHVAPVGRVIRHHGDYHLGQVLWTGSDWIVLDFEGEPARPLAERRRKRSPLRDVAGMLRSVAYAASASELVNGVPPPDGWEERARAAFLDGYFARVDRSLVPSSADATERLLAVFELEKAIYELRYELNNRPDWVRIPVAGIVRLLEAPL